MAKVESSERLRIVGRCDARLFGLAPAERLRRQLPPGEGSVLVAHASAVLGDAAIAWLLDNPRTILVGPGGRALAVAVEPSEAALAEQAIESGRGPLASADAAALGPQFVRKLRRRDTLLALSLADEPVGRVERALFASVYKGVTDLVTKYAWPVPALLATRVLARLGVAPNLVTVAGLALTLVAAWRFHEGDMLLGMAAAWGMTFLDTVDGKLARVTVTSSRLGNLLDHVTDYVHPPVWWYCLAAGLARLDPGRAADIWSACWVILGAYVAGRAVEEAFKAKLGFNQYLWRRFDSAFRLVVSRRNVILLIMTLGLLAGAATAAFVAAAAWSVASVLVQGLRLAQALAASRRTAQRPWLT